MLRFILWCLEEVLPNYLQKGDFMPLSPPLVREPRKGKYSVLFK